MTPSGAFVSCSDKLKGIEENRAEYEHLIEVVQAHNIRYFFTTATEIQPIPV